VTIAHGDRSLRLGIGRVDHRRPSLSGAGHDETGEAAPAPSRDLARFATRETSLNPLLVGCGRVAADDEP